MDRLGSRESDMDIDLESGETGSTSEEDGSEELVSDGKRFKKILGRGRSGYLSIDGRIAASEGLGTRKNASSIGQNMDMLVSSKGKIAEGGVEKPKNKVSKKHPKPPRPPTGPSILAADMEFVKEISERARLRRARRERMSALKRMKSNKASSSKVNLFAMAITTIFFLVIIFQGMLGARV